MKVCSKCKTEKDESLFSKRKANSDGLCSSCKECDSLYYLLNKDRISNRNNNWKKNNKEKNKLSDQLYRDTHKEEIKARNNNWKEKNSQRVKLKNKEYREKHKERLSAYTKKYCQDNKDTIKARKLKHYSEYKERAKNKHLKYYAKYSDVILEKAKLYIHAYAKYQVFADKLTVDESPILSNDGVSLEVKCRYCGQYFIPTVGSVKHRIQALNGRSNGNYYLYCSGGCRDACPLHLQKKWPKGFLVKNHKPSREVQAELRQMVFELDEWECQICGATTQDIELHCHHLTGVELNPIESADVDNCITLCKKCHHNLHSREGCTYNDFQRKQCLHNGEL